MAYNDGDRYGITVRLLDEEQEQHLLPDSPRANLPWHLRILRKAMVLLFSVKGLTILSGVGLMIMLTGIISLNYLDVSRNVKDEISQKDFNADTDITVVDQDATKRKIARALQSVPPVFQDPRAHNQDIEEAQGRFVDQLGKLAQNGMPPTDKQTAFRQLVQNNSYGDTDAADPIFSRYLKKPIPSDDWDDIQSTSQTAMRKILEQQYTEADVQTRRPAIIQQNIPHYGYKPMYRDLIAFILDANLQPNRILDEKATDSRRNEIARRINQNEPEMKVYSQGERIVSRGEHVSSVQLAALAKMGKSSSSSNWISVMGVFLLCMLFVFTIWNYLYHFADRQYFRPAYGLLIGALTTIAVLCFEMLQDRSGQNTLIPIYAFPLSAYALTLAIFLHPRMAVLTTTLLVFLVGMGLQIDFYHLSVLLFGSYMGLYILNKRINYSDRGQLMYAGFYVGFTNVLIQMALILIRPSIFPETGGFSGVVLTLAWGFGSGLVSGVLTIGCLPLLEKLFGLITPFTLMELGNHDQPLLKRMQFEAPGTFHHSLMVATLAEAAAEAVEANALLTRVGCLYHDIGKMKRPLFFIENQAYFGVENPHDKLTPRLSKMVITAHPRDSIEMAKHHKLPEILMKFMTEHHGTLTAGYFYNKACIEEGVENVNKSQFRYPGPKPGSKETAIVMLADAAESAVRALKNPTVAQVEERIDKIIQQRIDDGQFDNCPLTFKDINLIKQTFVRVLRGIQHNRIEYQQNMMRELGRKLPVSTVTEHSGLTEALQQVHGKQEKES